MPLISPAELGAPPKFDSFRPNQLEYILRAIDSPKRFVAIAAPTGVGKSLCAVMKALLLDIRTCILTSTKSLQTQYLADFQSIGMLDIRGQSSYQCIAAPDFEMEDDATVAEGICHSGVHCPLKTHGCLYYDKIRLAEKAKLVVTNYAMWQTCYAYGGGLGKFGLLVLDESHCADENASKHLTVEIEEWLLEALLGERLPSNLTNLQEWGGRIRDQAQYQLDGLVRRIKDLREEGERVPKPLHREAKALREMVKGAGSIAKSEGTWIPEIQPVGKGRKLVYAPLWPAQFTEDCLFLGVPKVLLLSATLRPKTLGLLGIKGGLYDFLELPSTFPVENRPVIHVDTIRVSAQSTYDEKLYWVNRIDQIIDGRLDRKGIIHSVAFKHADFIKKHSRHKKIMLTHDSSNTRSTVEQFKRMPAPAYIVSPSLTTGWDFPHDLCRVIILAKLPYPDLRNTISQARAAADPDYLPYQVAQTITQCFGRGNRAENDWCEGIIADDNWGWFHDNNRKMFPKWFLDACRHSTVIPKSPKL